MFRHTIVLSSILKFHFELDNLTFCRLHRWFEQTSGIFNSISIIQIIFRYIIFIYITMQYALHYIYSLFHQTFLSLNNCVYCLKMNVQKCSMPNFILLLLHYYAYLYLYYSYYLLLFILFIFIILLCLPLFILFIKLHRPHVLYNLTNKLSIL